MNTSWLEKILNVVLIVTCVLVSGVAAKRLTQDAAPAAPDPRGQPQGYTKGEVLPPIAGVRYAEREKTVVLFISSHCKYCVESMPFYARLSNLRKSAGFQLVVVSSEATKTITDLLAENRCEADHVKTIGPDDLKVFATPWDCPEKVDTWVYDSSGA